MVPIRQLAVSMLLCMSMTAHASAAASDASWKDCAIENQTCSFPGTRPVRYGADGTYVERSLTGPVACGNAVFGDPLPGVAKSCGFKNDPPVPETWTYCGAEATADICSFFGTRLVRYGADGSYVYRTASNAIRCASPSFDGDPAVGVDKTCSYASDDLATARSAWTECAAEDRQCNASGTGQVRYGGAATFVYKTVTGPFECSNTVFGDPIPNVDKSCSSLANTAPAAGETWTVADIGTLGGAETMVADINDSGNSFAPITLYNIDDGTRAQINSVSGAYGGVASMIPRGWNNNKEIVGTYGAVPPLGGPPTSFLYRGGVAYDLRTVIPGDIGFVGGMNDNGDLIGYIGARENRIFFLYENDGKALITLNDLPAVKNGGWQLDEIVRINNARQIIGYGIKDGLRRAILITPI